MPSFKNLPGGEQTYELPRTEVGGAHGALLTKVTHLSGGTRVGGVQDAFTVGEKVTRMTRTWL